MRHFAVAKVQFLIYYPFNDLNCNSSVLNILFYEVKYAYQIAGLRDALQNSLKAYVKLLQSNYFICYWCNLYLSIIHNLNSF